MSDCLSATGDTIFNMRVYQHVKDCKNALFSMRVYLHVKDCVSASTYYFPSLSTCQRLCILGI